MERMKEACFFGVIIIESKTVSAVDAGKDAVENGERKNIREKN